MAKTKDKKEEVVFNLDLPEYKQLLFPAILLYFIFLMGSQLPDLLWGVHFAGFLPQAIKVVFVVLPILLFYPLTARKIGAYFSKNNKNLGSKSYIIISILFSVIAALVFYSIRIETDIYGDSLNIIKNGVGERVTAFSSDWLWQILSPNIFTANNQEHLVFNVVKYVSYTFGVDTFRAFRLWEAFCGFGYVLSWLLFLNYYIKDKASRFAVIAIVLSSPFVVLFFGNAEVYSVSLLSISLFMQSALVFLRKRNKMQLLILAFLLVFAIKSHSVNFILALIYLLILAYHFIDKKGKAEKFFNWSTLSYALVLPLFILGVLAYIFIFKNHIAPENLTNDIAKTFVFLPLSATEFPFKEYTMFNWNHIFDYLNMILLWGFASVAAVIGFGLIKRKTIKWNSPALIISGQALFWYLAMFFAVNPVLSMPRDWDLFSIPGVLLMVFAVVLISENAKTNVNGIKNYMSLILAMCILNLPVFFVNLNQFSLANRIESVGIRVYNTYRANAGFLINVGTATDKTKESVINRLQNVLNKLPKETPNGKNYEYAFLLNLLGNIHFVEKDYAKAVDYFVKADEHFKYNPNIKANIVDAYIRLKDYKNGLRFTDSLLLYVPNNAEALYFAAKCNYELNNNKIALEYAQKYFNLKPKDSKILELLKLINERMNSSTKQNIQ